MIASRARIIKDAHISCDRAHRPIDDGIAHRRRTGCAARLNNEPASERRLRRRGPVPSAPESAGELEKVSVRGGIRPAQGRRGEEEAVDDDVRRDAQARADFLVDEIRRVARAVILRSGIRTRLLAACREVDMLLRTRPVTLERRAPTGAFTNGSRRRYARNDEQTAGEGRCCQDQAGQFAALARHGSTRVDVASPQVLTITAPRVFVNDRALRLDQLPPSSFRMPTRSAGSFFCIR
jgi:hypothetical protein